VDSKNENVPHNYINTLVRGVAVGRWIVLKGVEIDNRPTDQLMGWTTDRTYVRAFCSLWILSELSMDGVLLHSSGYSSTGLQWSGLQ
jgi:hypothetical protein